MIHPEIRLINKVLQVGNLTEVKKLKITDDFLRLAEAKEGLKYIDDWSKNVNSLGYVPSLSAFKKRFPNFTIIDEVKEQNIKSPAVIIIGEVVKLHKYYPSLINEWNYSLN